MPGLLCETEVKECLCPSTRDRRTHRQHSLRRRRRTYKDENNWAVLGDMLGRFDLVGLRDSDSQTDGRNDK